MYSAVYSVLSTLPNNPGDCRVRTISPGLQILNFPTINFQIFCVFAENTQAKDTVNNDLDKQKDLGIKTDR